jgi:hypothetical protein
MGETELYRHFDAAGQLLYIGISKSALKRLKGHRDKDWYRDIVQITIERHPSRAHALYAEAVAIRDESPIHNKARPSPLEPGCGDEPASEIPDYEKKRRLDDERRKLIEKEQRKCPEPVAADAVGRIMGYLCVSRQHLNRGIRMLRKAGVHDGLMFIDVVDYGGADQPNFERILKTAQHRGTKIVCDWPEEFQKCAEILKRRGVTVEKMPFAA